MTGSEILDASESVSVNVGMCQIAPLFSTEILHRLDRVVIASLLLLRDLRLLLGTEIQILLELHLQDLLIVGTLRLLPLPRLDHLIPLRSHPRIHEITIPFWLPQHARPVVVVEVLDMMRHRVISQVHHLAVALQLGVVEERGVGGIMVACRPVLEVPLEVHLLLLHRSVDQVIVHQPRTHAPKGSAIIWLT